MLRNAMEGTRITAEQRYEGDIPTLLASRGGGVCPISGTKTLCNTSMAPKCAYGNDPTLLDCFTEHFF